MDCSYQNRITQSHLLCDHNGLHNRWLGLEKNIWQYISIEVEKNDWFHMYLGIDFIEFVMYWTSRVTDTNFLLMTFSSLPLIESDNIFFEIKKEWQRFWKECWQEYQNLNTLEHAKFLIILRYLQSGIRKTFGHLSLRQ